MNTFSSIEAGDPAPTFIKPVLTQPQYAIHTAAGRYLVLCFYGSAASLWGQQALSLLASHRHLFDDERIAFFGISVDPGDARLSRISQSLPGIRHVLDHDLEVSRLYGAAPREVNKAYAPRWVIVDPNLRVRQVLPMTLQDAQVNVVADLLQQLPALDSAVGWRMDTPVLAVANVLEPALCKELMTLYEQHGGTPSGVMQQVDGKTVCVMKPDHKRRSDYLIEDAALQARLRARIARKLAPELAKIHHFKATRLERYLVGCYDAETQGHFKPHRDNTTSGTAHRRFAVSINLNSDFEGGEIMFPEYGCRSYKPLPGSAIVFSCSMLHAVTPVTHGRRFAFLPFLYDEAAAAIRDQNRHLLVSP